MEKETSIKWIECSQYFPEDVLPLKEYTLWKKRRKCTPYVLTIVENRERPDCAKRVCIDGHWYWTDGDAVGKVTHWATYNRPPFNKEEQKRYQEELRTSFRKRH